MLSYEELRINDGRTKKDLRNILIIVGLDIHLLGRYLSFSFGIRIFFLFYFIIFFRCVD